MKANEFEKAGHKYASSPHDHDLYYKCTNCGIYYFYRDSPDTSPYKIALFEMKFRNFGSYLDTATYLEKFTCEEIIMKDVLD